MKQRPTRRVYIEILTCHAIFYHLEDSRSHGNEQEAERARGQGARPSTSTNHQMEYTITKISSSSSKCIYYLLYLEFGIKRY